MFRTGTIAVKWALIPNAENLDEAQLEAASDAVGRVPLRPARGRRVQQAQPRRLPLRDDGRGAAGANALGRLYSLNLHPGNPTSARRRSRSLYNADDVIAAGGDIAISPDNIDISDDYLMINEDGTASSRP